ncbi:DUF1292 domain-containing protein [Atopobacter phocae]|uniref:DUF1292 domain-containing protein n=1 Tax=Atopobacter phocae TaxID=136492 RepID=UPI00046FEBEB|nr:DUF1292 domain-containing protein [Atopobacter phocae]
MADEIFEASSEDNFLTIIDEEGQEVLYQILFSFESEDFEKSYVIVYPASEADDESIELHAFSFVEDENGKQGELFPIESEEEWDMIDEVLNTFMDEKDLL